MGKRAYRAPVVQWIECKLAELVIEVRFLAGANEMDFMFCTIKFSKSGQPNPKEVLRYEPYLP